MKLHKNFLINEYGEKIYREHYYLGVPCINDKYVKSLEKFLYKLNREGVINVRNDKNRILYRVFDNYIHIK